MPCARGCKATVRSPPWRIAGPSSPPGRVEAAGIRDMRQIVTDTPARLCRPPAHPIEREISPATAQNALSAVNRVLEIARGDRLVRLDPVHEAGLPIQNGGSPPLIGPCSLSQHDHAVATVSERVAAILSPATRFGLRSRGGGEIGRGEGPSTGPTWHGAHRGRHQRWSGPAMSLTNPLEQKFHWPTRPISKRTRLRSPRNQTHREFSGRRPMPSCAARASSHGERHAYAQERRRPSGAPAPVAAGLPTAHTIGFGSSTRAHRGGGAGARSAGPRAGRRRA